MYYSLDCLRDCQQYCYQSMVVSYISFIALYKGKTLDFFQSSGNIPVSKLLLINNNYSSIPQVPIGYAGFVPFYEQKFQGLFKDFQVQKRALSLSFLVPPQNEQFHPEGFSVFAPFMQLRIWV